MSDTNVDQQLERQVTNPTLDGLIRCPTCAGGLQSGEEAWACCGCGRRFPSTLGIPDLRGGDNQQRTPDVERLVAAFGSTSLGELIAMRSPNFSTTDPALREHYVKYRTRMVERGKAFYQMVRQKAAEFYDDPGFGTALAIGCGAGSSMLAMASEFRRTIGIDPSLADLILAKKAVVEAGLEDRVVLIQGFAQSMPMKDDSIDFVLGEDVLEHVIDLDGALLEIGRVLRPGGLFVGNSVNRFNMLRPEPHVKLWFVGFLPRAWQAGYVRWRRDFVGYDRSARLPSYRELLAATRKGLGPDAKIVFPSVETFGFPAKFDHILRTFERVRPAAVMLLWIFPSHLVVGRASH